MAQRLFFALWPEPPLAEELLRRSRSWLRKTNGRRVARENLHITLAFLGNVQEPQRYCLEKTADLVTAEVFRLDLDQLAYWPGPRVVWAGGSETPEAFVRLALALQEGARQCGLTIDTRPPVAHLTLKRSVRTAPPGIRIEALAWEVSRFYLVASKTYAEGVVYERLRSWSLA